jgi:hypothetical protein
LVYVIFLNLGLASSCDGLLDFAGSGSNNNNISNGSGMRGKKRPSEDNREDVKSSKEPMLTNDHHQVLISNNTNPVGIGSGSGVLHQLLGPLHTSTTNSPSHHHVTQSASDSSFATAETEGQRMTRGNLPLSVATLQQQQQLGPSPPSAVILTSMNISSSQPISVPGPASGLTSSSTAASSSKLCEKNKMLASLLAKQPMQSSLSTSIASPKPSALPQEKLPKDLKVSGLCAALVNYCKTSARDVLNSGTSQVRVVGSAVAAIAARLFYFSTIPLRFLPCLASLSLSHRQASCSNSLAPVETSYLSTAVFFLFSFTGVLPFTPRTR